MSMSHEEMIAVIQAHANGGHMAVQYRDAEPGREWLHPYIHPGWNFKDYEWRITPTPPKPREVWMCESVDGKLYAHEHPCRDCRLFREVLPEEEGKA